MRHGPMVLRVCRNVLGDSTDAQDAFQATFWCWSNGAGRFAGSSRWEAGSMAWRAGWPHGRGLRRPGAGRRNDAGRCGSCRSSIRRT